MADIAGSDLTYSVNLTNIAADSKIGKKVVASISLGDGSLTYPTGGILLDKAKLGGFWEIVSLKVIESNVSGYVFEFDKSAQKLRILEGDYAQAGDSVLVELDGGSDAPAALALVIEAIVR